MNLRLVLCAVVVVSLFSCKSKPTLDGPCDPVEMEGLRGALRTVEPTQRAALTTTGIGEACEAKLPAKVVEGIKVLNEASVADRATLIASVLTESAGFTRLACADWENIVSSGGAVERSKRAAVIYEGCDYKRFDVLTVEEFDRSWRGSGYALLAMPMYAWLVDKNMEPAEAKRIARAMCLDEDVTQ
ncbi:MAG: hypothetical protein ACO1OB_27580 [Archangium sp.]